MLRTVVAVVLLGVAANALPVAAQPAPPRRSLTTDEPLVPKGKPEGAADYRAQPPAEAGRNLALTLQKLERGFDPPRPFVVWAIGSSYCNMLGDGEPWKTEIPRRFPHAPPIEYRKMVGNSCPWQYLRGWARHLVVPDQPDLVLIYTIGKPEDLEKLLLEIRSQTTADVIVPSIHWRERDQSLWGNSENAADQDVARIREVCRKYEVEFVENRRAWGEYLAANRLPIPALLKDAVHQSDFGAQLINANILSHVRRPAEFAYDPAARERQLRPERDPDGTWRAKFVGRRLDVVGRKSPDGGTYRVVVDGKSAAETSVFRMSYVQPDVKNVREGKGANPRDQSPHGITLGRNIEPQSWTIVMTSDTGDYELTGDRIGPDGAGNAFQSFTSRSGQITIEPELWRRAERNRTGDRFTFGVRRAVTESVDFRGPADERFVVRLAEGLPDGEHAVELVPTAPAARGEVERFDVYQPPLSAR